MTLQVDFDQFADAVQRHTKTQHAYLSRHEGRTLVSVADPATNLIIAAISKFEIEETQATLKAAGFTCSKGAWHEGHDIHASASDSVYISAVAYASGDEMPGVWVDAHAEMPTQAMVLKALYEEFRQTGEVGEISFEEFVRQANPNVVIVSPKQIESFLEPADCE